MDKYSEAKHRFMVTEITKGVKRGRIG